MYAATPCEGRVDFDDKPTTAMVRHSSRMRLMISGSFVSGIQILRKAMNECTTAPANEASDTINKVRSAVRGAMLLWIANRTSAVVLTIMPATARLRPATRFAGYHTFGSDRVRGVRKP